MKLPFKLYISYFYKIRFFDKTLIPASTAIWDPKWYHDNRSNNYIYKDSNNVINGIRIECLSPLNCKNHDCSDTCNKSPLDCNFIKSYSKMLAKLDFNKVLEELISISELSKNALKLDKMPNVCLIVHETPDNLCSERKSLIELFKSNGVDIEEFDENLYKSGTMEE